MEVTSHSPDMVYKLRPLTDIKVIAVVDQRGSVYWTSSRVFDEVIQFGSKSVKQGVLQLSEVCAAILLDT